MARVEPARSASPPGPARSSVVDREALAYLRAEIRPTLRRKEQVVLDRAVSAAVDAGSVSGLGRLPERHRRELLETIDARLAAGRPAPTPRALVRLTSVIATAPPAGALRARVVASPAR